MTATPIVFTDLDGTLLDHDRYTADGAEAALEVLRCDGIPLILCSSKTAAEMMPLRAALGFDHCPAVVENGAGLLPAHASQPIPEPRHANLLERLHELPVDLSAKFSGFSDWTPERLMAETGLDREAAQRAARREYSEPGLWLGDANGFARFESELGRRGIHLMQGGRFVTLGFEIDKAARMLELLVQHRNRHGAGACCIALGDAPNDIAMLQRADIGIIVPNPAHAGIPPLPEEASGRIRRAPRPGPAGWSEALLAVIDTAIAEPAGRNHG